MYILYLIVATDHAKRFAKGLGVIACVAAEISCLVRPQTATLVNLRNMKISTDSGLYGAIFGSLCVYIICNSSS